MGEEDLRSQVRELRRALTEKGQQVSELQSTVNILLRRSHNMSDPTLPQTWGDLYSSSPSASTEVPVSAPVRTYTEDEVNSIIDARIAASRQAEMGQEAQARNLVVRFAQEHPDLIPYRGAVIAAYMAAQGSMEQKVEQAVQQVRGMIASGMLPKADPPPQQMGGVMNGQIPGMSAGQSADRYIRRYEDGRHEQVVYNDEFLARELAAWTELRKAQLDARKEAGYR